MEWDQKGSLFSEQESRASLQLCDLLAPTSCFAIGINISMGFQAYTCHAEQAGGCCSLPLDDDKDQLIYWIRGHQS